MTETTPDPGGVLAGRYQIVRQIGQGGMATVYLAHDLKLQREVAVKVLRPDIGAILGAERFLSEVRITARLDHVHILKLLDSGVADGQLYYVMPNVRGESLRDAINREGQLGVEQALQITKQVASALDHAHRHGIVHRDIKPENVLLQEGAALLTDFGIALAVQESDGERLTETGLSLGTPHYMSPEQAAGERTVDARSDQYSLAAVLYEALVGEPPVTGRTMQAVVARLLSEAPRPVRTVRPAVAEHVDAAIARALSKVPADRFASVAEFSRALDAAPAAATLTGSRQAMGGPWYRRAARPRYRRTARPLLIAAGAGVVVLAVGALVASGTFRTGEAVTLRDRTQLTFTGQVATAAVSADGKQLAYFTKLCSGADCRYAVDVQDIGGNVARRVLDSATAVYDLRWSPDRRNLMVIATIGGRFGSYLVSALGGAARFLTGGAAAFHAGGDSLLIGPAGPSDSAFVIRVAGIDGVVRDSVSIPGPGLGVALLPVPGSSRFVGLLFRPSDILWRVHARDGTVTDEIACNCGGDVSADAIWLVRAGATVAGVGGGSQAAVRVALNPASGKLSSREDTVYRGRFTNVSVTADGRQLVIGEGTFSFTVVAGELRDFLEGRMPEGARLMHASTRVHAWVSPDGQRLLYRRSVPDPAGGEQIRYLVSPYPGGDERLLNVAGALTVEWVDSVAVLVTSRTPAGSRHALVDVRSGATMASVDLPDSALRDIAALPGNGWAWIPSSADRVIVERGGVRHEVPKPPWFSSLQAVEPSRGGERLLMTGFGGDSFGIAVVPVSGGSPTIWYRDFAEGGFAQWMPNGSIAFLRSYASDAVMVHEITGPGRARLVGSPRHVVNGMSVSADLQRATLMWREYQGDAWRYGVGKP